MDRRKLTIGILLIAIIIVLVFIMVNMNKKNGDKKKISKEQDENIESTSEISERQDEIEKDENYDEKILLNLQEIVTSFIDNCGEKGEITEKDYNNLIEDIENIDVNEYLISFENKKMSEKVGRKQAWTSSSTVGEDVYVKVENNEIMNAINEEGKYELEDGDVICLIVTDMEETEYRKEQSDKYKKDGLGEYVVSAEHSTVVEKK